MALLQVATSPLPVGVALNVRFTTNGMCVKNNTHIFVARTTNNRVISSGDLYCSTVWSFAHLPLGFSDCNSTLSFAKSYKK